MTEASRPPQGPLAPSDDSLFPSAQGLEGENIAPGSVVTAVDDTSDQLGMAAPQFADDEDGCRGPPGLDELEKAVAHGHEACLLGSGAPVVLQVECQRQRHVSLCPAHGPTRRSIIWPLRDHVDDVAEARAVEHACRHVQAREPERAGHARTPDGMHALPQPLAADRR